jgi:hypothetical protein
MSVLHTNVNKSKKTINAAEIKRRRHGGKPAEVPLDIRRLCEQLRGLTYVQPWQKNHAPTSEGLIPVSAAHGLW